MRVLVAFILCFFTTSITIAQETDVDYLSLTQLLIKDGNFNRAERTLKKVDQNSEDRPPLFNSLWGMIELKKGHYKKSLDHFNQSLAEGLKEKDIYLFIAEAHLQLGQMSLADQALAKLTSKIKGQMAYHLLAAEIQWRQGLRNQAWNVLDQALSLGLSRNIILKKKFYYLLDQGLFQSAYDLIFNIIEDENNFSDVLAMTSQLRIKKQNLLALQVLQTLNVMRPGNEVVVLEMAQNYLSLKEPFSAALISEAAVKHNNSLTYEAAEILRQVGKGYRARYLNLLTTEPEKKLKQQLALFLEDDDYFSLSLMIPQLRHHKLLEDQKIRYAVAYSLFKTGEFDKSEKYLNSIDDNELFDKSIELKKEIVSCRKQSWFCEASI